MEDKQHIVISAVVTTEEIPGTNRTFFNSKYHLVFEPAMAQPDKGVSFPASFVTGETRSPFTAQPPCAV
jgi:hypothetical protein